MADGPADGQQKRERLGQVLIGSGLITADQLRSALALQATHGKRLGQILVERGDISADDLAWAFSSHLGYPYVFLSSEMIDHEAVRLLPEEFLRVHQVLPILRFEDEMTLAMADPTDQPTVDEVAARTGLAVKRALALGSNIEDVLTRLYAQRMSVPTNAIRLAARHLQFHLRQALQQDASEIHFDPGFNGRALVRYRAQGVLLDRGEQPRELHEAVVALLRELSGAGEPAVATATADETVGDVRLHLTVTFLPTILGPAATVILLPQMAAPPDLASLGVPDDVVRLVLPLIQHRRGLVAIGCADRRLRAALLHGLAAGSDAEKVWSIEVAPVYRRPGVNQTVVTSPQDIPRLLRGAADAGADLILVDDVRARRALIEVCETGRGKTILAGLPQDHAVGLLNLMMDGVGTGRLASALQGVVAARPIRLLCSTCGPSLQDRRQESAWTPRGCEACGFTGYRGQRLLIEHWAVAPDARMLLRSGRIDEFFSHIVAHVESLMRRQGQEMVDIGLTSEQELAAVVEGLPWT